MIARVVGVVVLGFVATVGSPNPVAARMDLQLGPDGLRDSTGTLITIGTPGISSQAANSYKPAKGADPYYFNIPSERPAESAPGIVFHIPLGNDESR